MIEVFKSQVKISNEMEVRLANLDWSSTALGIYSEWPANLKATINIILRSPVPMLLLVGEEGITIFNNSFSLPLVVLFVFLFI